MLILAVKTSIVCPHRPALPNEIRVLPL